MELSPYICCVWLARVLNLFYSQQQLSGRGARAGTGLVLFSIIPSRRQNSSNLGVRGATPQLCKYAATFFTALLNINSGQDSIYQAVIKC